MKKIVLFFSLTVSIFLEAQSSNPYFPADTGKIFVYKSSDENIKMTTSKYIGPYSKTNSDSLKYVRTITYKTGEVRKDTMVYIITATSATFICMLQNGGRCDEIEKNKLFEIPPKNDSLVWKEQSASDMSVYNFVITVKRLPSYEVGGEVYRDVIENDLYNPAENYHWKNYYAKGVGLIEDGDGNYLVKVAK